MQEVTLKSPPEAVRVFQSLEQEQYTLQAAFYCSGNIIIHFECSVIYVHSYSRIYNSRK
jgi:hypothetical protein